MQRWAWMWLVAGSTASGMLGCGGGGDFKPADQLPQAAHDDHGHGHNAEGPHHGALVELGEEQYHAEIVVDAKSDTLKIYLLGPDAKSDATTSATEATLAIEGGPSLSLKPAADQTEGQVSLFEVVDEKAVHEIAEAGFIHGSLTIKIGDKEFNAGIDAHFHGDHDHGEMPAKDDTSPALEAPPAAEGTPEAATDVKPE